MLDPHSRRRDPQPGVVYLVGAGPGDPGLLTLRAAELLAGATEVYYDYLVSGGVLARCAAGARLVNVGKVGHGPATAQGEIERQLVASARAGHRVVRLKGGDPLLFGRGAEEALALDAAGIPFEIVPGVSSALAVPAYAGIPVTARGHAASVGDRHRAFDLRRAGADSRRRHDRRPDGRRERRRDSRSTDRDGPVAGDPGRGRRVGHVRTAARRDLHARRSAGRHRPRRPRRASRSMVIGEVVRLRQRLDWCGAAAVGLIGRLGSDRIGGQWTCASLDGGSTYKYVRALDFAVRSARNR